MMKNIRDVTRENQIIREDLKKLRNRNKR